MAFRNKNRGSKNSSWRDVNRTVTMRGRGLAFVTALAADTVASIGITPTSMGSTRLSALSDTFMLYRFTKFRFHAQQENSTAVGGEIALCYTPALVNANPTTLAQMCEFPDFVMVQPWEHAIMHVNRGTLLEDQTKWFRTRASGGIDDVFEYQGSLYYVTATAIAAGVPALLIEIDWEVEFKVPVDTGSSIAIVPPAGSLLAPRTDADVGPGFLVVQSPSPSALDGVGKCTDEPPDGEKKQPPASWRMRPMVQLARPGVPGPSRQGSVE